MNIKEAARIVYGLDDCGQPIRMPLTNDDPRPINTESFTNTKKLLSDPYAGLPADKINEGES